MMKKQAENKEKQAEAPLEAKGASEGSKEPAEAKKEPIYDYIDQLQRLQAEFENFKKREEREKERYRDFAKASILLKLVSFNDDFERTIDVLEKEKCIAGENPCAIKKGIDMMALQLKKILAEEGVQPISCIGQKLDPFRHEVLVQQEADKEDGVVLEELQKGYLFKGNVLRTAKVKVCKAAANVQKDAVETNVSGLPSQTREAVEKMQKESGKRDESKMENTKENRNENNQIIGGK